MASLTAKVCDTCGDVGFADCLAVCSQCKEGAEHVYCMARIPVGNVPSDWVCQRNCDSATRCPYGEKQRCRSVIDKEKESGAKSPKTEPITNSGSEMQSKYDQQQHKYLSIQERNCTSTIDSEVELESKTEAKRFSQNPNSVRVNVPAAMYQETNCATGSYAGCRQEQKHLIATGVVKGNLKREAPGIMYSSNSFKASESFEVRKHGQHYSSVTCIEKEKTITKIKNDEQHICNGIESISSNDYSLKASDSLDTCSALAADCTLSSLDEEKQKHHYSATDFGKNLSQEAHNKMNSESCPVKVGEVTVPSLKASDGLYTKRLILGTASYQPLKSINDMSAINKARLDIFSHKKSPEVVDPRLSGYRCFKCKKIGHLAKMCTAECVETDQNSGSKEYLCDQSSPERNIHASKSNQEGGTVAFLYDQLSPQRNRHASKNKRKSGTNKLLYDRSSPEGKVHAMKNRLYNCYRRNFNRSLKPNVINERPYPNCQKNDGRSVKISPPQLVEGLELQTRILKQQKSHEKYRSNKKLKMNHEGESNANGWREPSTAVHLHTSHLKKRFDSSRRNMTNAILKSVTGFPTYNDTALDDVFPNVQILWSGRLVVDWSPFPVRYEGFQAHTSNVANPKVRETMRNLPAILHLEALERGESTDTWPRTFQEHPPTSDCIGVYFFPVDMESYSMWYKGLLDLVTTQDLVLRLKLDVAQLLIFPSCLLPKQEQCWGGKHFLWGVFRANKMIGESITERKLPHLTSVDEFNLGFLNSDNGEVIDMEIDMIGGIDVH